jgi:predicted Rossmann fold flavoprotein
MGLNDGRPETPTRVDLLVVGAGAAGLATAIFAAERAAEDGRRLDIALVDGTRPIGRKILIAGGGRCNVTNARVTPEDFNGRRPVVRNVLAAFTEQDTVRWFAELGVPLKTEPTGKLFPVSDRAQDVLAALVGRAAALGITLLDGRRVEAIEPLDPSTESSTGTEPGFVVQAPGGRWRARRVVLATGGRSLPRTGSDGGGYGLAEALGHTVTDTFPALVPLVLAPGFLHGPLAGVSHRAELTTLVGGKVVDRRAGSLLWTHFGVSGPVALDASRHWIAAERAGLSPTLSCGFLPGRRRAEVEDELRATAGRQPRQSIAGWLAGALPRRLAEALCSQAGLEPHTRFAELARPDRERLARDLTGLALPVVGPRGWDHAEVTAGGVPLAEVDYRTMASRRRKGLYLVGEILDVDGRIGGFNFQWAWATGHLAGRAAAASLLPARPGRETA